MPLYDGKQWVHYDLYICDWEGQKAIIDYESDEEAHNKCEYYTFDGTKFNKVCELVQTDEDFDYSSGDYPSADMLTHYKNGNRVTYEEYSKIFDNTLWKEYEDAKNNSPNTLSILIHPKWNQQDSFYHDLDPHIQETISLCENL